MGTCDISFTFPTGTYLTGLTEHRLGNDILAFGDSIWFSPLDTGIFYKLADLESGEHAVMLTSTAVRTSYAVLTNLHKVYYGRIGIRDYVTVPSQLLTSGEFIGTILFDGEGRLFALKLDTPSSISSSQFPVGIYLNEEGTFRDFADPSVLHKTQLPVSGYVSSSDYTMACPLSLQIQGTTVVVGIMDASCSFDFRVENRVLELESGGTVLLGNVLNSFTRAAGTVLTPLSSLSLAGRALADASITLGTSFPSYGGSCTVDVYSDHGGFESDDVGRTLVYRLDSIFLTTYVDPSHVSGLSLACNDKESDILSQATTSSIDVILYGGDLFSYEDGPNSSSGWLIPSGAWYLYDLSGPSQYHIISRCQFTALSFEQTMAPYDSAEANVAHVVDFIDVGDAIATSAYVAPTSTIVEVYVSGSDFVSAAVVSTRSFTLGNGRNTNNITFSFTGNTDMVSFYCLSLILMSARRAEVLCYCVRVSRPLPVPTGALPCA